MELRFDGAEYAITGTPEEMWAFLTLDNEPEQVAPVTIQTVTTPAVVETPAPEPAPAPAKKTKPRKEFDVGKARALRNAKWSYEKIGEELHCSAQTVINHLKAAEEAEQHG